MKVSDITRVLESAVPLEWQADYDNSGLVVGNPDAEISLVSIALDVTEEVVEEAVTIGAGMIVTHHPVIFNPIRRLTEQNGQVRAIAKAIGAGIALYACHTNLDSAPDVGISHRLAQMLGLSECGILEPVCGDKIGIGIVGTTSAALQPEAFLRRIKDVLNIKALRYSPVCIDKVRRVAICSGSGGSLIGAAKAAGADVYIAADFKYHDFTEAEGMIIVDAGHFETEICAIEILFDILSKKIPTFALRKSACSRNPVNYIV